MDLYRVMLGQIVDLRKSETRNQKLEKSNRQIYQKTNFINTTQDSGFRIQDSPTTTLFLEMMTRQVEILRNEFGEWLEFEEVKTFHFNIRIVKAVVK